MNMRIWLVVTLWCSGSCMKYLQSLDTTTAESKPAAKKIKSAGRPVEPGSSGATDRLSSWVSQFGREFGESLGEALSGGARELGQKTIRGVTGYIDKFRRKIQEEAPSVTVADELTETFARFELEREKAEMQNQIDTLNGLASRIDEKGIREAGLAALKTPEKWQQNTFASLENATLTPDMITTILKDIDPDATDTLLKTIAGSIVRGSFEESSVSKQQLAHAAEWLSHATETNLKKVGLERRIEEAENLGLFTDRSRTTSEEQLAKVIEQKIKTVTASLDKLNEITLSLYEFRPLETTAAHLKAINTHITEVNTSAQKGEKRLEEAAKKLAHKHAKILGGRDVYDTKNELLLGREESSRIAEAYKLLTAELSADIRMRCYGIIQLLKLCPRNEFELLDPAKDVFERVVNEAITKLEKFFSEVLQQYNLENVDFQRSYWEMAKGLFGA